VTISRAATFATISKLSLLVSRRGYVSERRVIQALLINNLPRAKEIHQYLAR
jgi:hypothetical protein